MGNNSYCDVAGIGTVKVMLPGDQNLHLTDVLYSPTMKRNLISVPRLDENDFEVRFRSEKVSIGKHGRIMMWGSKVDGLYRLNIVSDVNNNALAGCSAYTVDSTHSYDSLYVDDPYIWFVVHHRYQSNPGEPHWAAVKRILRYIQGTKDYKLTYHCNGDNLEVVGYLDADFSGDVDDSKSTSAYVFLLGGGAISWSSKKQSCVAKGTMEAEYISYSGTTFEAIWIKRFLEDLRINEIANKPIAIMCDNQAAI
ncbi:hypothetical protein RHSIM_Rhsim10G0106900 [Rhododendron simsii]|uniref:Retrovirus-related Pol polyprotein from transposon TNT 1-94-like beta-barrel domain-containing protein n=1 Tax=Rhododendron simsii TaxID=118357 RepID=A0A834LDZ5_RHOSS|nr:hypothetical protein RHSIM_Rhsim10G0106900 [Rhododendron simsii]